MEGFTNETFRIFRDDLNAHFEEMCRDDLFRISIDNYKIWNLYLDSYPEEMQVIYRENRWQDCQACRSWFRKMAGVVNISVDGEITTIFDFETLPQYQHVIDVLSAEVKKYDIQSIFLSSYSKIGEKFTLKKLDDGEIERNGHLYSVIPDNLVVEGKRSGVLMGKSYTSRLLLERSLNEIGLDAVDDVLALIEDNNLYRGMEWKRNLELFRKLKIEFSQFNGNKDAWLWKRAVTAGSLIASMKNHSIGVLLIDLTEGMDPESAIRKYESIVAPSNYQRPKPVFTKQMLDSAREKVEELGYENSLRRRFAVMEDVSVNNVLFANRNLSGGMKDLFDELEKDAVVKHRDLDYAEEIDIKDFISNVLPNATEVNLFVSSDLSNKFVSLIAPVDKDAPSMFKWNNGFSWAYKNNLADSMKEQVKALGGDVDVDLRFSIRWNNKGEWDENDLDAHCTEPNGNEIYFSKMQSERTGGWLDVDIVHPENNTPAVENIQYKNRNKMLIGEYKFRVHQFSYRGGDLGFEAEIEFDDKVYSFNFPFSIPQGRYIDVAIVYYDGENFELREILQASEANVSTWGIAMNDFAPVSFACFSPNHWNENDVGNKHVFFMLQDCKNSDRPNAWFNEYLNAELREHRNVMEALANRAKIEESDNQLSGIGFSLTQKGEFKVKVVENNMEKLYKVII